MSSSIFVLLPFVASMCYGLSYIIMEKTLGVHMNPATFMTLNLVCNILVILALVFVKQENIDFSQVTASFSVALMVCIAAAAPTLGWVITIYSIKNMSALYTALAETSYPLFTLAFGLLIFGIKTPSLTTIGGGLLILAGAALMIYGKNSEIEPASP